MVESLFPLLLRADECAVSGLPLPKKKGRRSLHPPRPPLAKIRGSRVVRAETRRSRAELIRELEFWLEALKICKNLSELVDLGEIAVNYILERYSERLYYAVPIRPVGQLAELLNGVRGAFPLLRHRLPLPWNVVGEWRRVEPTESHIAVPRSLPLAWITAALLRGWPSVALAIWLGADLGLRPVEITTLAWRWLSLPADRLDQYSSDVFVTITNPEAAWSGARAQHARGGCGTLISFISALKSFKAPEDSQFVIGGSGTWLTSRFKTLVADTRVPYGESQRPKGVVLASLRASFASELYESCGDLSRVSWRMRIKNLDTLGHYTQELQSQQFVARQPQETRAQIRRLCFIRSHVIQTSIQLLRAGVVPTLWPRLWTSGKFDR